MPVITEPKIIKRGEPVGVLYRRTNVNQGPCNQKADCMYSVNQNTCYCIHNGVLYRALYKKNGVYSYHKNINPSYGKLKQVTLRHWGFKKGTKKPCLQNLVVTKIAEVRKTAPVPTAASLKCENHPPATGTPITRGTPVGVLFNENGKDIKNGVFLYWENNNNNRYCKLYKSDNPKIVAYLHWIVVKSGNGVAMQLDIKPRSKIKHVYRVSVKQDSKNLCSKK